MQKRQIDLDVNNIMIFIDVQLLYPNNCLGDQETLHWLPPTVSFETTGTVLFPLQPVLRRRPWRTIVSAKASVCRRRTLGHFVSEQFEFVQCLKLRCLELGPFFSVFCCLTVGHKGLAVSVPGLQLHLCWPKKLQCQLGRMLLEFAKQDTVNDNKY